LPFKNGGRDWSGVDCWGLVRLVLLTECKVETPTYGEVPADDLIRIAYKVFDETSREPWHPATSAQPFDLAVMYRRLAPIHVGIMVDGQHVLHVEPATLTVMLDVRHPSVLFRRISYFRHQALLDAAA
jgi:cell wall-associated NlpC family hydrolase